MRLNAYNDTDTFSEGSREYEEDIYDWSQLVIAPVKLIEGPDLPWKYIHDRVGIIVVLKCDSKWMCL